MNPAFIPPLLDLGKGLIDRLFPNKIEQAEQRAKAELELQTLVGSQQMQEIQIRLSAIVAEAQSPDPWTSRARPSFLYVVYILMLSSIPMGILTAVSPDTAVAITNGFKAWLEAIPHEILALFGTVMLGYTGARTIEKVKKVAK